MYDVVEYTPFDRMTLVQKGVIKGPIESEQMMLDWCDRQWRRCQSVPKIVSLFENLVTIYVCLSQRIKRKLVGEEVKGVGVTKDEELKLEEIEDSLTLGS